MDENKSKVYALIDEQNRVLQIDGGYSIQNVDLETWTFIDEGEGDKYNLCQSHYLEKPIRDMRGIPQYKYVDDEIVERTQEEIDGDYVAPIQPPTEMEKLISVLLKSGKLTKEEYNYIIGE